MAAEKKQITRNRVSHSCQICRRRKVKCNKVHPVCGGCQRAGENCVYSVSFKEHNDGKASVGEDTRPPKRRADAQSFREESPTSAGAVLAIEQRLTQLKALMHDLSRLTPASSAQSLENNQGANASRGTIPTDSTDSMRRASDRPWERVIGKMNELNEILRSRQDIRSLYAWTPLKETPTNPQEHHLRLDHLPQSSDITVFEKNIKALYSNFDKDMLAPTAEESNVLFRSWLWSTHSVFPILSPKLVLQKYQTFNNWYRYGLDAGEPNPDPLFMPFLVLIWYTGFSNLSERARQRWFPWVQKKPVFLRNLRIWLERHIEIMKHDMLPSKFSLAAAVISQYMAVGGQDLMANNLRNTLNTRAAQTLGLHNERTLKTLSENAAETSRRLWWEAVTADASLSTVSGMPVVIDECYTNTRMVSELKDASLGTKDAEEYQQHLQEPEARPDRADDPLNNQTSSLISVYNLTAKARYLLTATTKKVLKANMRAQPMKMDEMKDLRRTLMTTSNEVHAIISRIPTRGIPELDFMPETNGTVDYDHLECMGITVTEKELSFSLREDADGSGLGGLTTHHRTATIAFHKWARIALSMMVDRLNCISYAPFLKNSKSRLWSVARQCALRSCHGFMRKYLCLAEDSELRRFRWAWSTMYHPIHATIILLVDLHERPHSEEAARSRALIDKMFSLAAPGKGLIDHELGAFKALPLKEGGVEPWEMLRKLRHKAWHKAGLDPDVLWSEEDQLAVGIGRPLSDSDLFLRSLREDLISKHKQIRGGNIQSPSISAEVGPKVHCLVDNIEVEHLHPSEIASGEPISGSIARAVADLLISDVPPVILLRARRDQEVMPFSLWCDGQEDFGNETNKMGTATSTGKITSTNSNQVFHIGELIRRIRQSQTQNGTSGDVNRPTLHEPTAATPLDRSFTPYKKDHHFRNFRDVQNAAFQDHLDMRSTMQSAEQPSGIRISTSDRPRFADEPRFNCFPLPPTHDFSPQTATYDEPEHRVHIIGGQAQASPGRERLLSTAASVPAELHSDGPPYQSTTFRQNSSIISSDKSVPTRLPEDAGVDAITADINSADSMADDFDWDRWDEMFGHFAGFENMLMDDGAPAELEQAVAAMHDEGH